MGSAYRGDVYLAGFFTQQLFESTAALWVTIGAMTVVSFFLPAFVRKLRGK